MEYMDGGMLRAKTEEATAAAARARGRVSWWRRCK